MIDKKHIKDRLRTNANGSLHHREGQELEFKEQFNFSGLGEYLKDFAAFANNKGGVLIFGVSDSPRKLVGLSAKSRSQFERIDPEQITGFLLEYFSGHVSWAHEAVKLNKKVFGAFKVEEAEVKPIIAKKDAGKDNLIKSGEVYFRYGGRTQKIQYSELENIINKRIESTNSKWMTLVQRIGKAGPENVAVLDTEKSIIEKDDATIHVIDRELAKKLKFIKDGEFSEKKGATTLKLVGDVQAINSVEVVKKIKEDLINEYPLTATELVSEIKKNLPECKQHEIYDAIKENSIKDNKEYSAYNFRNNAHRKQYEATKELPSSTPSIYKPSAVDFLCQILRNQKLKE